MCACVGLFLCVVCVQMGDVVVGVIQQIKPYGAFVDIGGVTGLLHVSQITGGRITQVDKVFAEGDKVKVRCVCVRVCVCECVFVYPCCHACAVQA